MSTVKHPRESPEIRLLTTCCSPRSTPETRAAIARRIADGIEWGRLSELASWHRLSGFLLMHLGSAELRAQVPPAILEKLRLTAVRTLAKRRRDRRELRRALLALESSGIPAIVLKGAALVETVYREPVFRPMGDIDLLIEEPNLDRAEAIVRSLDYTSPEPSSVQQEMRIQHHRHIPPLFSRDRATCFEIHRHIVRKGSVLHFDISGFWERARPADVAGVQTLVLSPGDLLIHLLLNLFQDARQSQPSRGVLGKLTDLAESIRFYGDRIDWPLFVDCVAGYGATGPVACGLTALSELLGVAAPKSVFRRLEHRNLEALPIDRFIDYKLLEEPKRVWFFHELVEPPDLQNLSNELRSAARLILFGRRDLGMRRGRWGRRWRRHLEAVFPALASAIGQPRRFRGHLRVDRWMHSLMT